MPRDRQPIPGYPQGRRVYQTPPEIPPPPKVPTLPANGSVVSWLKAAPPWAIGIIAILLVGGSTLQSIATALGPKPATAEQNAAILDRQRATDERLARIEKKLDNSTERGSRRDQILVEGLCKLNGGKPIARGAPCDELVWNPPPLDADAPWSAREVWPE